MYLMCFRSFLPEDLLCSDFFDCIPRKKKKQSNCSYNLYSRMCICVLCVCVNLCILLLFAHYKCMDQSTRHHLIRALNESGCESRAPTALRSALCNTSLVLDFIKISHRVAKYWCGRHICQFKLPSKAYRPCGRKLPFRALRPLNC